ncbi:hypothetical protein AVEN_144708-1 [Araneus ventricosus]|uniref:Uncharacterized protein n=1 Tax=Araneus ventricosus TaxID=182803 RepID=A0A4Y2RWF7_ARAVE|nr:hypothetical protein AVEN_144708-1 [Araneus ventricosus]
MSHTYEAWNQRGNGIFSPTPCRRELSNCGIASGRNKRPAALLTRMSQTYSIGFMPGEYASQTIRRIPSSKRKLSNSRARCGLALSSMRMDSFPIVAA